MQKVKFSNPLPQIETDQKAPVYGGPGQLWLLKRANTPPPYLA